MLDNAHNLGSKLHVAQARMGFELARSHNANAKKETATKREIAKGHNFASKRVSLSTFGTRKFKFEVFRQTCSRTIRRQFKDKMQTLETTIAFFPEMQISQCTKFFTTRFILY